MSRSRILSYSILPVCFVGSAPLCREESAFVRSSILIGSSLTTAIGTWEKSGDMTGTRRMIRNSSDAVFVTVARLTTSFVPVPLLTAAGFCASRADAAFPAAKQITKKKPQTPHHAFMLLLSRQPSYLIVMLRKPDLSIVDATTLSFTCLLFIIMS